MVSVGKFVFPTSVLNVFSEIRRSSLPESSNFHERLLRRISRFRNATATYLAVPGKAPSKVQHNLKTRISVAVAPGGLRGATRRIAIPGFSFRPGQIRRSSLVFRVLRKLRFSFRSGYCDGNPRISSANQLLRSCSEEATATYLARSENCTPQASASEAATATEILGFAVLRSAKPKLVRRISEVTISAAISNPPGLRPSVLPKWLLRRGSLDLQCSEVQKRGYCNGFLG